MKTLQCKAFPSNVSPVIPDVSLLVSNSEERTFQYGKEIDWMRGGVLRYAEQATLKIDADREQKNRFRIGTEYKDLFHHLTKNIPEFHQFHVMYSR